jgi:carnitine O-acetyltransferase
MSKSRTFKSTRPAKSTNEAPPGYSVDPSAPPMLRFQASLPRLPVPTLSSTAAKYLETVRPLLTPTAFSSTEAAVAEFLRSPLAAELQKRLQARAGDPEMKNWLADWWNEVAYLAYRDPVVVFVSYFFVHMDDKLRRNQVSRAAALVKAMLPFRELTESCVFLIKLSSDSAISDALDRKHLEPDKMRATPLCMDSYQWL